jgi:hypothetical protein
MEDVINNPFSDDPIIDAKLKEALLYKRNIEMAEKIEKYILDDKKYFVVLGAGHYIGEKSIIEILEKTNKYIIQRK